jgi:hypothetical protein
MYEAKTCFKEKGDSFPSSLYAGGSLFAGMLICVADVGVSRGIRLHGRALSGYSF